MVDTDKRWIVKVLGEEAGETSDDLYDREFVYGSSVLLEHRWEEESERIRIWKMGHPPILLQDLPSEFRDRCTMKVDERFILCNYVELAVHY
jgi:hypothetical protein